MDKQILIESFKGMRREFKRIKYAMQQERDVVKIAWYIRDLNLLRKTIESMRSLINTNGVKIY